MKNRSKIHSFGILIIKIAALLLITVGLCTCTVEYKQNDKILSLTPSKSLLEISGEGDEMLLTKAMLADAGLDSIAVKFLKTPSEIIPITDESVLFADSTGGNDAVSISNTGSPHTINLIYRESNRALSATATITVLYKKIFNKSPYPMVLVEGGTFRMGKNGTATPVHTVTVSSFYIGKYLITQKLYEEVTGNNPSNWKGDLLPVNMLSWYDAVKFANALSERDGYEKVYEINGENVTCDWTKNGYRLPTEAEWEFAAIGGNRGKGYTYAGGNNPDAVAWYRDNSGKMTQNVGSKVANELGLFDMSGNVWEWCWDWHAPYSSSPQNNPHGPDTGKFRILRGGGWHDKEHFLRTAYRGHLLPKNQRRYDGFRLVRNAE